MQGNIRNVDLNLLVALDALYEERSVTRAADRLALTQPTVSGMLKRLRHIFDDELFIRTSNGIIPTPRADALAGPVGEFIAAAQTVLVRERFDPATAAFDIRLSGSDYLQNSVIGVFCGQIFAEAPTANIAIHQHPASAAEVLLTRGETDLFFHVGEAPGLTMPSVTLFSERLICISSYRNHTPDQFVSLSEFCALRNARLNSASTQVSNRVDKALSDRRIARRIAVTVPTFAGLFEVMRHSELVALVPEQLARPDDGGIKRLISDFTYEMSPILVYWHPRMTRDARHSWLRGVLRKTAEAHFPEWGQATT